MSGICLQLFGFLWLIRIGWDQKLEATSEFWCMRFWLETIEYEIGWFKQTVFSYLNLNSIKNIQLNVHKVR